MSTKKPRKKLTLTQRVARLEKLLSRRAGLLNETMTAAIADGEQAQRICRQMLEHVERLVVEKEILMRQREEVIRRHAAALRILHAANLIHRLEEGQ